MISGKRMASLKRPISISPQRLRGAMAPKVFSVWWLENLMSYDDIYGGPRLSQFPLVSLVQCLIFWSALSSKFETGKSEGWPLARKQRLDWDKCKSTHGTAICFAVAAWRVLLTAAHFPWAVEVHLSAKPMRMNWNLNMWLWWTAYYPACTICSEEYCRRKLY